MSRSTDGKCPDAGEWCGVIRDWCDGKCMVKEFEDLKDENERLKASVEPVLECNLECHLCDGYCTLIEKIKESKRIYNGGVK